MSTSALPHSFFFFSQRDYRSNFSCFSPQFSLLRTHHRPTPFVSLSSSSSPPSVIEEEEQQQQQQQQQQQEEDSPPNSVFVESGDEDDDGPDARPFSCKACGREQIERGCNGEGSIQGGIATIPGFGWWPIKAYRPCPGFVAAGGNYRRRGQSMDEVASGGGKTGTFMDG